MVQAVAGKLLDRDDLHEIHHTQSAPEASCSASRQSVIRTNSVITSGLRGVVAYEDRTSIMDLRHILFLNGNVFRCNTICEVYRLLPRAGDQHRTVPSQRSLGNFVGARGFPGSPSDLSREFF